MYVYDCLYFVFIFWTTYVVALHALYSTKEIKFSREDSFPILDMWLHLNRSYF